MRLLIKKTKNIIKKIPLIGTSLIFLRGKLYNFASAFIGFIYAGYLNIRHSGKIFVVGYVGLGDYMYALKIADYIRLNSGYEIFVMVPKSQKLLDLLDYYSFLDFKIYNIHNRIVYSINFFHTYFPNIFVSRNKFVSFNLIGNYGSYPKRLLTKYNININPSYLIQDLNIKKPKTESNRILISPYSNTVKIEFDFYHLLINTLNSKGYDLEIIGKAPTNESFSESVKFTELTIKESLEYAKNSFMVIGTRSGYMEFLIQSKVPIVFLHKNYDYFPSNAISNYLVGTNFSFKEIDLNFSSYKTAVIEINQFLNECISDN